ncbi:MAG: hypothetical protein ACEQSK_06685 [Sphingomonadaceae bacterium]
MNHRNRLGRLASLQRTIIAAALLAAGAVNAAGHPSLEGVWKLERPQSELVPVQGQIPFTEDGRKDYEANKAAGAKQDFSYDRTQSRCSSPGLPRIMLTPRLFAIHDRPHMVTMQFEWNRLVRQIDLRQGPDKLPNPMQEGGLTGGGGASTMMGETSGQWEGKVLVARTKNLSDKKLLDAYLPSGEDLELTEHFRLRDANTLEDRITIKDPANFTQPWDTVLVFKRQPGTASQLREDICIERRNAGELPLPR